ncbi:arrestin (or S-antigen), N-terminal domain protein [Sugiyamaella lignohabitans]|uniref:Arrestin (Or S-antigen), N-terminal domain protein n=1 Tax=Sugiyamaella lignohabitans TaxID=796027 RepID=A0A167C4I7_9ASCO|nr:arrestin (or S-antigen), N-terminal domain protein [Sugiyamaella lignohabitans]ANB11205.1 arrestin (or S-antigen), N-terminal domain protein [Sugiyamaella lignohabitans]
MTYLHRPQAPPYIETDQTVLADDDNSFDASHNLPEYTSTTTCEITTNPQRSIYDEVLRVSIDTEVVASRRNIFDVGDVLTGSVTVAPIKNMEFYLLLVDLVGTEMSIRGKGYAETRYTRVFSLARYTLSQRTFSGVMEQGSKYKFTYSMIIPDKIPHERCVCGNNQHSQVPPSIGRPFELTTPCGGEHLVSEQFGRILYQVRAKLVKPETLWKSSAPEFWSEGRKYLVIRPSYPPPMLEQLCDVNGKPLRLPVYMSSKSLKKGLVRKTDIGKIELRTSEALDVYLGVPHTNVLNLEVLYTPSPNLSGVFPPPVEIENVSYQVDSLAFSSTQSMVTYPSHESVIMKTDPCTILSKHTLLRQKLTISKPAWTVSTPKDPSEPRSYLTKLTLPFTFPVYHSRVVDTYFSCLTSRQYELIVSVGFGHSIGSHRLTVPVLVSSAKDVTLSVAPSFSSIDTTSNLSTYTDLSIPSYQETFDTVDSS